MNYLNTKNATETVSFKEATLRGLASRKGLFIPESIPSLPQEFFREITTLSDHEIAAEVMAPFVEPSIKRQVLEKIVSETLSFPTPVVKLDKSISVLELFHGPTMAFKDVGARFIARCMSEFTDNSGPVKVIVATSGDTGSAVAHGFHNVEGVEVYILFPKNKVSPFQEQQMTTLGGNINALEVDGTFDDCQALAKKALNDAAIKKEARISSANSINTARFLPQMIYYFLAYKQIRSELNDRQWFVSVPSGNFGNLTAGLYAKKMGLPVDQFIAANNANDTFFNYWKSGDYLPKPSVETYSNAMDVGTPSNFERIMHLYNSDHSKLKKDICSATYSDKETLEMIEVTYRKNQYILDPHGAVGLLALQKFMAPEVMGTFLATAHPRKFESVIQKVIPEFPSNAANLTKSEKAHIKNDYLSFRDILLA